MLSRLSVRPMDDPFAAVRNAGKEVAAMLSEFQPLLGPDCTVADVLGAGFDRAVPDGMAKQADLEDLRRRHAKLLGELTGKETR